VAVVGAAAGTVPGWASFIDAMMQTDPGLGSCLMEAIPSLEGEDRLIISCPAGKTFQLSRIRNEISRLEQRVKERFGRKLVLNLVDAETDAAADKASKAHRENLRRRVAPTDQEELTAACREDSTLAGLVELLDGEAVPSQEVPNWINDRRKASPAAGEADTVAADPSRGE